MRSYLLKEQHTMRLISSSWEICLAIHTHYTQMCLAKEKATENSNSISGLTPQRPSTLTLSFGTNNASCKSSSHYHNM